MEVISCPLVSRGQSFDHTCYIGLCPEVLNVSPYYRCILMQDHLQCSVNFCELYTLHWCINCILKPGFVIYRWIVSSRIVNAFSPLAIPNQIHCLLNSVNSCMMFNSLLSYKVFYLCPFSIYNYDVWCYFTRYVNCSAPHNLIIGCTLSEYIIFIKLTLVYSNSMKQMYKNDEWRYTPDHRDVFWFAIWPKSKTCIRVTYCPVDWDSFREVKIVGI